MNKNLNLGRGIRFSFDHSVSC